MDRGLAQTYTVKVSGREGGKEGRGGWKGGRVERRKEGGGKGREEKEV